MKEIFNPNLYHGKHKSKNFFEGWYYKIVDKKNNYKLAIIPGISYGNSHDEHHSFIQIFNGKDIKFDYLSYDVEDFKYNNNKFRICINSNIFSLENINISINNKDININGNMIFKNIVKWPDSIINPGSMGFYNYLRFMECYSRVCVMNGSIGGELNINGISYYYNTNNSIYSTNTVSYKKALVINPSIMNNFEDVNTYQIKIRFQKKYFQNIWSEWSNTITLYKSKITELNLLVDQIIEISHYKTVRNYSTRLYDVYFINRNFLPKDNIDKNQYDIIITENYQGIYDTILAIKNKVNNYATFDSERENIKFNQNINDLDGNNKVTKGEIITANKISNNPIGRNYMNILINDMNKLY